MEKWYEKNKLENSSLYNTYIFIFLNKTRQLIKFSCLFWKDISVSLPTFCHNIFFDLKKTIINLQKGTKIVQKVYASFTLLSPMIMSYVIMVHYQIKLTLSV